jgi:hypothetical protein
MKETKQLYFICLRVAYHVYHTITKQLYSTRCTHTFAEFSLGDCHLVAAHGR